MKNLDTCAAVMATRYLSPSYVVLRVNNQFRSNFLYNPHDHTILQFWKSIYVGYCSAWYRLKRGAKLTIVVVWGEDDDNTVVDFNNKIAYAEAHSSTAFFRLLSANSPDTVRTSMPLDWGDDPVAEILLTQASGYTVEDLL